MTIPDYITQEDLDARHQTYHGAYDRIEKKFGESNEIKVVISETSSSGPLLRFEGLSVDDGSLYADVDFDKINEAIHLILLGDQAHRKTKEGQSQCVKKQQN